MKILITTCLCFTVAVLNTHKVSGQDIHYIQYDATPLAVNPAFTGMFDGRIRASALFRNQWGSVNVPFVTYGASFDMPLFIDKKGDYLAGGIQIFKDQAGDGNLNNFSGTLSVAYHKFFGFSHYINDHHGCDLAVGLQAA